MKKFLSLFIVILIIFSCFPMTMSAFETESTSVTAKTVLSGGQGTGFYDTSESGALEISGAAVVLRESEWAAYDISGLESGYYSFYITSASNGNAQVSAFLGEKSYTAQIPSTGTTSAYSKRKIITELITGTDGVLKIQNNSATPLYIAKIWFERTVPEETVVELENVIKGGQGTGFYDNGEREDSKDILEKVTSAEKTVVCIRNDEWTAHDISALSKGTYIVNISAANTDLCYINVYVDSYVMIKEKEIEATESYGTYKESFLGVVHLEEGNKTLKVANVGTAAMYADYITLSKISDDHILVPELKTYGKSVYSDVEGEGFHDEAGLEFSDSRVHSGTDMILHSGDWAAYSVSDVKTGVYEISACVASKANTQLGVVVDGSKQTSSEVPATGSYGTFTEVSLGKIYLDGAEKLQIINEGSGSVYLRYFVLKLVSNSTDGLYELEITPTNVIEGGQGVGYYDNLDITPNSSGNIESSGSVVTLRESEWLKYDVSGRKAGEYRVYINMSSKAEGSLKVTSDVPESTLDSITKNTGEYSAFEELLLGTISLTEETTTLKIENTSSSSMMIKGISIKMIPVYESLKLTKDAPGLEEADRFFGLDTVYLTGEIQNVFYASNGIKVLSAFYDENAKLLTVNSDILDIKIGETGNVCVPISVEDGAAKMKVLVWASMDRLAPLFSEMTLFAGWDTHYYVDSESGNDSNSGLSENAPLATIGAAQSEVRNVNDYMLGDIYVHLSGEFETAQTLMFTAEDSGTNGFSVIYDGAGEASVSGGKRIAGLSRVEGTPLYKTTVENTDFRQLYVNGNRAQRARSKWLYWAKAEYTDPNGEAMLNSEVDGYVLSKEDFPEDFTCPDGMEFVWMPSWKNVRMPVSTLSRNDDGDYVVTFPQPYFDSAIMADSSQPQPKLAIPFYIENAPEYLDEPGEWYHNKTTGELFYYPLEGESMETPDVYIPQTEMLLSVSGSEEQRAENITFCGIEFKYGAWNRTTEKGFTTSQAEQMAVAENKAEDADSYPYETMPAQIRVDYGRNINFEDNKFSHLGSVALAFDNKTEKSAIVGNVFDDVSASAIVLSNTDFVTNSPVSDFVRSIEVKNNLIRRISVEYMTPAITAYYVNNAVISHNDILDCPYTGISLGWGWGRGVKNCTDNLISNNRIENVLYKLKDGGHIYTLDIMTGTVVENNYLIKSGEWKGGIYLDNATENLVIRNNVFEDCEKWLKLTWHNVINNTAYDNYSETGAAVSYPDTNSIAEATAKTDGVWPVAAQDIIAKAGLEESYKHLLTEYEENTNYRNAELGRMPYIAKPGITVPAGELIEGGEGVAYHDIVSTISGIGITDSYDGTGHRYIMNTSQGEWTKHSVDIEENGTYKLYLNAAATSTAPRVSIWIDDVLIVDKGTITNTGTYATFADNEMATLELTKGTHIIKVEHTVANFGFYSLRFENVDEGGFSRNDGFVSEILNAVTGNN